MRALACEEDSEDEEPQAQSGLHLGSRTSGSFGPLVLRRFLVGVVAGFPRNPPRS